MSRWFRHYAGMMRDDKLVRAALRCKQPIERVAWVWGAILESAAEIDDDGRYDLDDAEAAYFLRADEADIRAVVASLVDGGRLAEGRVVKWGDRQFKSDTSAERVRRHREKRKSDGNGDDDGQQDGADGYGNADVTLRSRSGNGPETETETETETENRKKKEKRAYALRSFDHWYLKYPHKVGRRAAENAYVAVIGKGVTPEELDVGLAAYIRTKPPDRPWCNPATWLNQERWKDQPAEAARPDATVHVVLEPGTWVDGQFYAHRESEQFEAWREYDLRVKGQPPPTNRDGCWLFPSEYPPVVNMQAAE